MAMVTLSPWRNMRTLREAMDELMEESFVRPGQRQLAQRQGQQLRLPLDVYTTPEEIVIVASLAGLTPDEVEIVGNWPPITADDVLDMHVLLREFDGDLDTLLAR